MDTVDPRTTGNGNDSLKRGEPLASSYNPPKFMPASGAKRKQSSITNRFNNRAASGDSVPGAPSEGTAQQIQEGLQRLEQHLFALREPLLSAGTGSDDGSAHSAGRKLAHDTPVSAGQPYNPPKFMPAYGAERKRSSITNQIKDSAAQPGVTDQASLDATTGKTAASGNSFTSADKTAMREHLDSIRKLVGDVRPESAEDKNALRTISESLKKVEKHFDENMHAADRVSGTRAEGGYQAPGGTPGFAEKRDPIQDLDRHNADELAKDKAHDQGIAAAKAQAWREGAIASMNQLHATVTAFSQSANAQIAAMCNMILDCIKAINELLKKGGSMMSSAVGH